MQQLTFDLPVRTAVGRDDYFVSGANGAAVAAISRWQDWPGGKLVLCGPDGSGKTHLAHVWAAQADAQVTGAGTLKRDGVADLVAENPRIAVEDVDGIAGDQDAEQALFHLHNLALAEGGRLLLTGQSAPANWPLSLPDLKSRVLACDVAWLDPPDDALLSAVLVKLFADHQLDVSPDVVGYLVLRIERSLATAGEIVAALDAAALAERRAITRNLARRVLNNIAGENP